MVFLQVTLTQKLPIVPYAGIAAGYEWLHLTAKDYRTDADTSLTYANLAWEWYAGVGLKLSQSMRVDGEVYYNGASLTRDVPGANNRTLKEAVDMDGAGVRIGLNIVY
jgi:opacity protein-like surface antigen